MDKSGKLSVNLQYKFLKIILGVGKKSSNWAVLSEVGRSPLCAKVMVNMAKYWFHLVNTPSPILREAFFGNVSLSLQGIKSWFTMVKRILVFLGIDHILYTTDLNEIAFQIGRLKNIVQSKYRDIWKAELNEHILKGGKLSFFTQFKKEFGLSGYLNKGLAPELRIALTRLRISAHKLPIETGRYRGLERAQRTCPYCCIAIGDEQHYLVNCQNVIIKQWRDIYFEKINRANNTFNGLDNANKVLFLMTTEDPNILNYLGCFVHKIENMFKECMPAH
jgi:hypothetical protein